MHYQNFILHSKHLDDDQAIMSFLFLIISLSLSLSLSLPLLSVIELWNMESKKAPQDKLSCIARSCKKLFGN